MTLHPIPLHFLTYEENLIFFFISVQWTENEMKSEGNYKAGDKKKIRHGGMDSFFSQLSFLSLKINNKTIKARQT